MALAVKNEGSAEFRGQHSCRVEFQVEDTATHEITRVRKTFRVESKTIAAKKRCIREFRAELESGVRRDASTTTFGQYAAQWLMDREADPDVEIQTVHKNRVQLATINMTFGNKLLGEITRQDVKTFKTSIMTADSEGKAPTASGKPMSGATAHGVYVTLKAILQEAVRDELLVKNPCADLKAPSIDTKEKEPLTVQQAAAFRALLDAAEPRPTLVAFRLMLFAGLRRGEVIALRWSDFNPDASEIYVRRTLVTSTMEFKDGTKTDAGIRTIPLDAGTVDYLKRFRTVQSEKLVALGKNVQEACICADANSRCMHPENLSRSLRRFGKTNGFPGVTPHILRHTYCTLLFAAGTDLKTVQTLMGHNDPTTTMRIYTHYVKDKGVQAAAAVNALMESLPTTNITTLNPHASRWGIAARPA